MRTSSQICFLFVRHAGIGAGDWRRDPLETLQSGAAAPNTGGTRVTRDTKIRLVGSRALPKPMTAAERPKLDLEAGRPTEAEHRAPVV